MPDDPSTPIRVLFVDDDPDVAAAARLALHRGGMTMTWAASPDAAWLALAQRPDVVLLDLNFSRTETSGAVGLDLLARLLLHDATLPVVVVTGHSGVATAVAAMRAGACDFLIKPWRNERLVEAITRAAGRGRSRPDAARPAPDVPLLGDSAQLVAVRALVAKVAPTAAAVFIHGAAGVGKSLVATILHRASGQAGEPVTLDARSDPTVADVAMAVNRAAGGTLLIEDVDRLTMAAQSALVTLTAARMLATSRQSPAELRASGAIRDDLLARLTIVELNLPTLRDRGDDVRLLADFYLGFHAARHGRAPRPLDPVAAAAIAADPWPDSVRGLAAACERAVVLGEGERHTLDHFALIPAPGETRAVAATFNLAQSERALVAAALARHAHNVSRAADDLGITRATLYRRMARHGL